MNQEGYKVLIVDDIAENIRVAANILRAKGYNVSYARDGQSALNRVAQISFDLILLDIMMPGMDGFEVCKKLKEDPASRDIPVIFLTAKTDTESVVEGFQCGGVDYVTKPFNAIELEMRVSTHIRLLHAYRRLHIANQEIRKERAKADQLLRSIFPAKVADDLKNTGTTKPQRYEYVTVFFSDIVGYTPHVAKLPPEQIIAELNDLFSQYDAIMEANDCERIQTVGDGYLAVCGMPVADDAHAIKMCKAAKEILEFMQKRNEAAVANDKEKWEIRIGMHSGPVVGGVVGITRFAYGVFGDTINTAARMETSGERMKINVSEQTAVFLKGHFPLTDRGVFEVKGKGKMKMFFVE